MDLLASWSQGKRRVENNDGKEEVVHTGTPTKENQCVI
jgi:hypothetical protein